MAWRILVNLDVILANYADKLKSTVVFSTRVPRYFQLGYFRVHSNAALDQLYSK